MMNAEELLNNLNARTHLTHNKDELMMNELLLQDNEFSSQLYHEDPLPEPPEYFMEILKEQKKKKIVNDGVLQAITKVKRQKEKSAYLAFNQGQLAYLSLLVDLSKNKNQYAHHLVSDAITKRFNKVNYELQNGNMLINRDRAIKNKNQFEMLNQMDVTRLLKIKDGNIRSKLQFLQYKLSEMEKIDSPINPKVQEVKNIQDNPLLDDYKLGSEKTKIASQYIKHMTEKRRQMKKRERIREEKEKKSEEKRISEIKELETQKQKEKKEQIVQRMKDRKKKLDEEKKEVAEKEEKVQKFLSNYRKQKPLFLKISHQYQKKLVQSQRYHEEKLKKIKQKKKAYSLNDMSEHQKKYSQLKKKEKQKKVQEKQMYEKSLKINNKVYFKGSIHDVVEEVDKAVRQKDISNYQAGLGKQKRRNDYSKRVKEDYRPRIDEEKRRQLMVAIQNEELKKKKLKKQYKQVLNDSGEEIGMESYYEQTSPHNHVAIGNKYLQFAKLKKKKLENQPLDIDEEIQQRQQSVKALKKQQRSKQRNGDKVLWSIRSKQIEEMSQNIGSPKEFQRMRSNFQNFDGIAAKKEKVLKHANMSLQDHLNQKNALDNYYLDSIKNKMKLLE